MVLYGILVALSAVIVGVYAVWNLTVRPPEIPQEPDPAPPAGSGSQAAEPVEQEQPAGRQRREDVYNFVLLAGTGRAPTPTPSSWSATMWPTRRWG